MYQLSAEQSQKVTPWARNCVGQMLRSKGVAASMMAKNVSEAGCVTARNFWVVNSPYRLGSLRKGHGPIDPRIQSCDDPFATKSEEL